MKRQIKFRAWCPEREIIFPISAFPWDEEEDIAKGYHYYDIMQFTGLTDKNGKEIYEGDIVSYTWGCKKHTAKGKVVFSNCGYGFVIDVSGRHNIDNKYGDYMPILNIWDKTDNVVYEILGNIHENTELLEK